MHRVALVLGILGGLFWISLPFYPSECVPVTGASEVFCNRLWTPALLAMLTGAAGLCWLLRPRASRSVRWSLLAMTIGFAMMAVGNGLEYWVVFKLHHQSGIGGPIRGLLWMTALAGWLVALVAACVAGVGLYRGATGFALPRWPSLLFVLPLPLTLVFAALGPTWAGGIQLGLLGVLIGLYGLALPTRPSESARPTMRVPVSAPRAGTSVIRHSVVIPFPLEKVWGLMIKPERMAEWNTEIPEVLDIAGPMDRIGGGYRQVWRFAGRRMVSPGLWLVTAVEPLRYREFRGITPMGPMVARDWFQSVEGGTRLTIEVEYTPPGGALGRPLDPLFRAMFRRTIARNGRALAALLAREQREPK